jgi:hypothetical protein
VRLSQLCAFCSIISTIFRPICSHSLSTFFYRSPLPPIFSQCDFEDKKEGSLKKIVDEAVKAKQPFTDKEVRGQVRKLFAEKYAGQASAKVSEKKATGLSYFYSKLRF